MNMDGYFFTHCHMMSCHRTSSLYLNSLVSVLIEVCFGVKVEDYGLFDTGLSSFDASAASTSEFRNGACNSDTAAQGAQLRR